MRGISFVSVYFFYSSMPCFTLLRYFREAVLGRQESRKLVSRLLARTRTIFGRDEKKLVVSTKSEQVLGPRVSNQREE